MYNHIIYAAIYIWENLAVYDQDFRLHMETHPQQYWAIIPQQAWSMRLKFSDRFKFTDYRNEFKDANLITGVKHASN